MKMSESKIEFKIKCDPVRTQANAMAQLIVLFKCLPDTKSIEDKYKKRETQTAVLAGIYQLSEALEIPADEISANVKIALAD